MGASFVGGQVGDTLELDDCRVDSVTRETFNALTSMAIAAMQTSGEILIAQGNDNVDHE